MIRMELSGSVRQSKAIWRQMGDQLRRRIQSGELSPGTKLPSTGDLADELGTNRQTMHLALADLVREGLLSRKRKLGTFVTEREAGLRRVGLYHSFGSSLYSESNLNRCIESEIKRCAQEKNIAVRVWVDPRPIIEQSEPLQELADAARSRDIQGLITCNFDPMHTSWLKTLPVPVTALTNALPSCVDIDYESFLEVSLRTLKEQGCRTVSLLTPRFHRDPFERFASLADRLGLKIQPRWIAKLSARPRPRGSHRDGVGESDDYEWMGYQTFRDEWPKRPHPDGLIVYPESLARGVILGLLTHQVRVPEDLRVVLHKHRGIDYLCPLPVSYAITSIQEMAAEMLMQLDLILKGHEPRLALVKFHRSDY